MKINHYLVLYKVAEYTDLREFSAKETVKIGFDGYSIGGTSGR